MMYSQRHRILSLTMRNWGIKMHIDATIRHGSVALTENGNTRALLTPADARELAVNLVLRAAEAEQREMQDDPRQMHLPEEAVGFDGHRTWCQWITQGKKCNCKRHKTL